MKWPGRRSAAGVAGLVLVLTSVACTGGASEQSGTSNAQGCRLSAKLVPSCGALWGITTQEPTTSALAEAEKAAGRKFDFVYRFHDINDAIPTPDEQTLVARPAVLHLSIDAKDYREPGSTVRWGEIAGGAYDEQLRSQAAGVAAMRKPVFVTFDHEADQPLKGASGHPAEFVSAWRHVHDVFVQAGATNAVWVWVMTGAVEGLPRARQLWPGNAYVDWISWDVYNPSGCRRGAVDPKRHVGFEQAMRVFFDWLQSTGPSMGIDLSKPMMISEAGSVIYPDDRRRTADWYRQIPTVLRKYPQIKAIGLWDHTGQKACDYRFTGQPDVEAAVRQAGEQPWMNVLGGKGVLG